MLKEVVLFADSEELTSTSDFKMSVGLHLCTPKSFQDQDWTHDDWEQTRQSTLDKLKIFESVTITTNADGDLVFKNPAKASKYTVTPSPEEMEDILKTFNKDAKKSEKRGKKYSKKLGGVRATSLQSPTIP